MKADQTAWERGADDFDYIRRYYKVPAEKGQRVVFGWDGREGTIVGSEGHYLQVRFDGEDGWAILHPTWKVRYLEASHAA